MPANWDPYQNINLGSRQVEWPQGPMTLATGVEPRWIEAWVVQGGSADEGVTYSGPSQRTAQRTGWAPGRWTADGIPPGWINGSFQVGPALGIALLASHNNKTNADEYLWWLDVIDLY